MQRLSWDLLRQNWTDQYFIESLAEFISRLHEDRGKDALAVVMFSPEGEPVPPLAPPVHLLVLYREPVDFLKDNLFLRRHDPSGLFCFFSYGIDSFRKMIEESNPLALQALGTGLILHETDASMREFIS